MASPDGKRPVPVEVRGATGLSGLVSAAAGTIAEVIGAKWWVHPHINGGFPAAAPKTTSFRGAHFGKAEICPPPTTVSLLASAEASQRLMRMRSLG
jgi:hypothetical protein